MRTFALFGSVTRFLRKGLAKRTKRRQKPPAPTPAVLAHTNSGAEPATPKEPSRPAQKDFIELDSDYGLDEAEFEAFLSARIAGLLKEKGTQHGFVARGFRDLYVIVTAAERSEALQQTLASVHKANRDRLANVKPVILAEGEFTSSVTGEEDLPVVNGAAELATVLEEAIDEDLVLFVRAGDEVNEFCLQILDVLECGRYELCLVDMAFTEDGRTFPLFLPGINTIHALNCDYLRSRFFASAPKVFQKLSEGVAARPRALALSLFGGVDRKNMPRKCKHVPIPLLRIGETRADLDDERRNFQRDKPETKYANVGSTDPTKLTVSVVICTRDKGFLVEQLVNRLLVKYPSQIVDIVIVSNQTENAHALRILKELSSRPPIKVIDYEQPFNFSEQCNLAAAVCSGDILLFLNDDIVPVNDAWLDELLSPFRSTDVGVVGPLLLYPDEKVQHCGIYMGYNSVAGHGMRFATLPDDEYMFMTTAPREVTVVTGAALAIRRDVFDHLNGFDRQYSTYIQDVDLCLRVHYSGWKVVLNPRSVLLHMESVSVRPTLQDRGTMESRGAQHAHFANRWKDRVFFDPYHNVNYFRNDESLRSLTSELQACEI